MRIRRTGCDELHDIAADRLAGSYPAVNGTALQQRNEPIEIVPIGHRVERESEPLAICFRMRPLTSPRHG